MRYSCTCINSTISIRRLCYLFQQKSFNALLTLQNIATTEVLILFFDKTKVIYKRKLDGNTDGLQVETGITLTINNCNKSKLMLSHYVSAVFTSMLHQIDLSEGGKEGKRTIHGKNSRLNKSVLGIPGKLCTSLNSQLLVTFQFTLDQPHSFI